MLPSTRRRIESLENAVFFPSHPTLASIVNQLEVDLRAEIKKATTVPGDQKTFFFALPDRSLVDTVRDLQGQINRLDADLRKALSHCNLELADVAAKRVVRRIKK